MTDDLVKRLRQYPDVKLPNEAADRIEKLETAMKEIASLYEGEEIDDGVYARDNVFIMNDKIEQIISKALEEKDD